MQKLCPHNVIVGLDTAYLKLHRPSPVRKICTVHLPIRCMSCAEYLRTTYILESLGIVADGENLQCEYLNCFKQGWRRGKYCEEHFIFASRPEVIIPHEDSAILRASLRGETLWTYQTRYAQAFKKVNDRDGTKVVCLDLEFSSTSRLVFEVGMCDYYSGKDLINARIKHDPRWLMTSIPASTGKSLASGGR